MGPLLRLGPDVTTHLCKNAAVHHSKNCALMSQMGQERRIGAVRNTSALPPMSRRRADIVEPPMSAKNGCEHTQQTA
jgi:hypothetical protein